MIIVDNIFSKCPIMSGLKIVELHMLNLCSDLAKEVNKKLFLIRNETASTFPLKVCFFVFSVRAVDTVLKVHASYSFGFSINQVVMKSLDTFLFVCVCMYVRARVRVRACACVTFNTCTWQMSPFFSILHTGTDAYFT